MTAITPTTTLARPAKRNVALLVARVYAGSLASLQLAGATYFMFFADDQTVWRGPWVDVPVVTLMISGQLLLLAMAVVPGLNPRRRITTGLLALGISLTVTPVKISLYHESEGVLILVLDGILTALVLLARRTEAARD